MAIPTPKTMTPTIAIWIPCDTQSGLAYMKEDCGPTMDWP